MKLLRDGSSAVVDAVIMCALSDKSPRKQTKYTSLVSARAKALEVDKRLLEWKESMLEIL